MPSRFSQIILIATCCVYKINMLAQPNMCIIHPPVKMVEISAFQALQRLAFRFPPKSDLLQN